MCTASDSACMRRAMIASGPPAPPRAPVTRSAASVRSAGSAMAGPPYPGSGRPDALLAIAVGPLRSPRMPERPTDRAVAEAAPLETARRAAGARGAGSQDPLVGELRRAGLLPLLVLHFLREDPSYGGRLMGGGGGGTRGPLPLNPTTK